MKSKKNHYLILDDSRRFGWPHETQKIYKLGSLTFWENLRHFTVSILKLFASSFSQRTNWLYFLFFFFSSQDFFAMVLSPNRPKSGLNPCHWPCGLVGERYRGVCRNLWQLFFKSTQGYLFKLRRPKILMLGTYFESFVIIIYVIKLEFLLSQDLWNFDAHHWIRQERSDNAFMLSLEELGDSCNPMKCDGQHYRWIILSSLMHYNYQW